MLHTIVGGILQQLSTAFVAAALKKHWSTTSERDQTSCHNSTSASELAPCLNVSQDVITTRGNHSSFTNAYEKLKIFKCPDHSQNNMKYCQKLDAQHMEVFFQGWVHHRRLSHAQTQTHLENHRNNSKSSSRMSSRLPDRIKY